MFMYLNIYTMSFAIDLESSYSTHDDTLQWQRRLNSLGQGCAAQPETHSVTAEHSNIEDPSTAAIVVIALLSLSIISLLLWKKHTKKHTGAIS